jgi:hypothetical protein
LFDGTPEGVPGYSAGARNPRAPFGARCENADWLDRWLRCAGHRLIASDPSGIM